MSEGKVLQVFEGYVLSLDGDGFDARLVDVTAGDTVEGEEARIPWSSLPGGRPDGIRKGTYLRWRIMEAPDGEGRSDFAFDIAGVWTAEELARAKVRGAELAAGLEACFEPGEAEGPVHAPGGGEAKA